MNLIDINCGMPKNDKYRIVILEDGLHICKWSEISNSWIDREGWYYNDVTHWQQLPEEK
ncbi:DUF551 domain-containing protein [Seonamhaeicola sp.]|uniref:DUF551 domain-containing protein n=1 Tax=Seonamhaeicola sp. TaxID=1912245 RepID=UPI0035650844